MVLIDYIGFFFTYANTFGHTLYIGYQFLSQFLRFSNWNLE
jgi:hypothetical protein